MFKVIVWASDGSAHADRALEYAQKLAEANSAKLIATHVREINVGRAGSYPVEPGEDETEQRVQAQAKAAKDSGIDAEYEQPGAHVGGAAHAIADLAAARNADLIVVGTRGQGPVKGLLLGSVTQRLLHIATCPVLAVPPGS